MISDFGEKENQERRPITEKSRISLPLTAMLSLLAGVFFAALGYAGTTQALNEKITRDEARAIAVEVVGNAGMSYADKTSVAVLTEKVSKLEETMRDVASENKETNRLLRKLAKE